MTQPSFAPVPEADQVRPSLRLKTPEDWRATRVAELRGPVQPHGAQFGVPGPDQGYALKLGDDLFASRLELVPGETKSDAIYGCAMVASARASLFGRAPVAPDLDMALTLFGYLGGAPQDLIEWRVPRMGLSACDEGMSTPCGFARAAPMASIALGRHMVDSNVAAMGRH